VVKAEAAVVKAEAAVVEAKAAWQKNATDPVLLRLYENSQKVLEARQTELAERWKALEARQTELAQLLLHSSSSSPSASSSEVSVFLSPLISLCSTY
jgi:hypothetical protein